MFSLMFYGDKNSRVLELRVGLLKFFHYISDMRWVMDPRQTLDMMCGVEINVLMGIFRY